MLTIAIPSKGRLKEACGKWFEDHGVLLEQAAGSRGYRASFAGLPQIEVMLLSASEIASSLLAGDVHMGITGEDLLRVMALGAYLHGAAAELLAQNSDPSGMLATEVADAVPFARRKLLQELRERA